MNTESHLSLLSPKARTIYDLLYDQMPHTDEELYKAIRFGELRRRLTDIRRIMGVEIESVDIEICGRRYAGFKMTRQIPQDLFMDALNA